MTSLGLQTTQIASNQAKSHFIYCLVKDSAKIRPQEIFISYSFKLLFIDNKCNFDSEQFYFTNKEKQVCFFNETRRLVKTLLYLYVCFVWFSFVAIGLRVRLI